MTWSGTLTPEQAVACRNILRTEEHRSGGSVGWSILLDRSIGTPRYVELRKRSIQGTLIRRVVVWENGQALEDPEFAP